MKNAGKNFEEDFFKSAIQVMDIERLKDPSSSFNIKCQGCPKQVTRFSVKNICDFICFKQPNQFYLELKSHLGKSIPFAAIKKKPTDTRLFDMTEKENNNDGIYSFILFNWRDCDNDTYFVNAELVNTYINYSDRKSIPFAWTVENGVKLDHKLKRVRYSYDVGVWLSEFEKFIEQLDNEYGK